MDDEECNSELSSRVVLVSIMVCCIVVAHVFMWLSDMPRELKVTFTVLNASGWTIVLAPILLVDKWLGTIRERNNDE